MAKTFLCFCRIMHAWVVKLAAEAGKQSWWRSYRRNARAATMITDARRAGVIMMVAEMHFRPHCAKRAGLERGTSVTVYVQGHAGGLLKTKAESHAERWARRVDGVGALRPCPSAGDGGAGQSPRTRPSRITRNGGDDSGRSCFQAGWMEAHC